MLTFYNVDKLRPWLSMRTMLLSKLREERQRLKGSSQQVLFN